MKSETTHRWIVDTEEYADSSPVTIELKIVNCDELDSKDKEIIEAMVSHFTIRAMKCPHCRTRRADQ